MKTTMTYVATTHGSTPARLERALRDALAHDLELDTAAADPLRRSGDADGVEAHQVEVAEFIASEADGIALRASRLRSRRDQLHARANEQLRAERERAPRIEWTA